MTSTTSFKLVTCISGIVLFLMATNWGYSTEPVLSKLEVNKRLEAKALNHQKAIIMKELEIKEEKKKADEATALMKACNSIRDDWWEDMKDVKKMKASDQYLKCQEDAKRP